MFLEGKRKNAYRTVIFLSCILAAFMIADLIGRDRLFSPLENRVLAQRPEPTKETILSGDFAKNYEEYVNDQFVSRDTWIRLKTNMDLLMQKKVVNGVYLGKDDYLIEQHLPEAYDQELVDKRLEQLQQLCREYPGAKVLLAPTADNILTDKMPDFAPYYDERALLARVKEQVGQQRVIDVFDILQEHAEEDIYYRTDHHWTTLGASYAYRVWAEQCASRVNWYRPYQLQDVSTDFRGTLQSLTNLDSAADRIQIFPQTQVNPVQITYDDGRVADSFYEESYLDGKNQYGFFLDDTHGLVQIETSIYSSKTLFLIKDSYANCMIPMLASHYQKIYVLDLRYFNGKLFNFMGSLEESEEMDVLVLYNCIHFLEDFQYWE